MKNKKLKLEDLKIQSFITDLNSEQAETLKGGAKTILNMCPLDPLSAQHSACRTCEFHCDPVE